MNLPEIIADIRSKPPTLDGETVVSTKMLWEWFLWSLDACHQGTMDDDLGPGWHNFLSTWEEADEFLPEIWAALFEGRR